MTRYIVLTIYLSVLLTAGVASEPGQPPAQPVKIDFFYQPGCAECERINAEILPKLEAYYSGLFILNKWDTNIESNYFRLASYLDQYNLRTEARVFMVIDAKHLLAGFAQIDAEIYPILNDCILSQSERTNIAETATGPELIAKGKASVAKRARQLSFYGVFLIGLLDGINPCAIATLVFFISLLLVSKVHGRLLLLAGMAFCAASYVTYFAIGFGLFNALHALMAFRIIQQVIELAMILTLACLAFLSFRDAFRFHATQRPGDITLQLPDKIKKRIHAIMRRELSARQVVPAALIIGSLVTALEFVCTGQVYLPAIVYLIKSGEDPARGLTALMIYNLAFILPLVIILVLMFKGMTFQQLTVWSKTNVVISKILLGCFFVLMAVLIALI